MKLLKYNNFIKYIMYIHFKMDNNFVMNNYDEKVQEYDNSRNANIE